MNVRVQYTGQLRTALRRSEESVSLPEAGDVAALFAALVARVDADAASHLVTPGGKPQAVLLVVVNGTAVPATAALATRLRDGDVITLLPPIAGG